MRSPSYTYVASLSGYVEEVQRLFDSWNHCSGGIWFRGSNNCALDLLPGLYWRPNGKESEDSLVEEFVVSVDALVRRETTDQWALYALMQHHRLPTRLLDWSKSPLVALYFAMDGYKAPGDNNRVVWAIDPYEMNERSTGQMTVHCPTGPSSVSDGIDLDLWLPPALRNRETQEEPLAKYPIAIEPPFTNKRLYAQQGCFTAHGDSETSISRWLGGLRRSAPPRLHGFLIESTFWSEIQLQLFNLGIKEDSIYQDLDNLSARIIRERFPPAC